MISRDYIQHNSTLAQVVSTFVFYLRLGASVMVLCECLRQQVRVVVGKHIVQDWVVRRLVLRRMGAGSDEGEKGSEGCKGLSLVWG